MSNSRYRFLAGGGDAARQIIEMEWASTALGPIDRWPDVLKTTVGLMLRSGFPKAFCWGPEMITFHNNAFRPILGNKPPAIGRRFSDIWSEAWESLEPIALDALNGKPTFITDFPVTVRRSEHDELAYFTFSYSPVPDADGNIVGFMDTVVETTKTILAVERSDVLNAELGHRIKNILALVGAIVTQTIKATDDPAEIDRAISGRLRALAEVQDVLRTGASGTAEIHGIISRALAPHSIQPHRITAGGPNLSLDGDKALSLSLALNELLTNAIKYGSLSDDAGTVEISWEVSDGTEQGFNLTWHERGGPKVSAPSKAGFGSRLIQRYVAGTFGGTARVTFDPEGIVYEIRARPKADQA